MSTSRVMIGFSSLVKNPANCMISFVVLQHAELSFLELIPNSNRRGSDSMLLAPILLL